MIPLYSYKVSHAECPKCGCKEAKVTVYHLGATFDATCPQCDMGTFGSTVGTSEIEAISLLDKIHDNFVLFLGESSKEIEDVMDVPHVFDETEPYEFIDDPQECGNCGECSCERPK